MKVPGCRGDEVFGGMQDMRLQFESYYRACPSLSGSRLRTSHACNIRMGGRGQEKVF